MRRALSALAWIALGSALGGVLLLALGLLWASVTLLVYAGCCWLIARYWPELALGLVKLGYQEQLPGGNWQIRQLSHGCDLAQVVGLMVLGSDQAIADSTPR